MTAGGANQDTQGLLNAVFDPVNQALRVSSGLSGPPTGAASGDLSGSYPSPVVAQSSAATFAIAGNVTVADAKNIAVGTTTGTKIATAANQKLSFWGVTPIVQPARAGQLTDNSGGTSGGTTIAVIAGAVDPTAATVVSTANAIATLAAKVNALEVMLHNLGLEA